MDPSPTLVRSPASSGQVLRETRVRLGLTHKQVARLLATIEAQIDRIESETLRPDEQVDQRISALAELSDTTAYRSTDYLTIPALAKELKLLIGDGGDVHDVLQLLIQTSDDFSALEEPADLEFFLAEPAATGDCRHDCLLAGLTVHLCRRVGLRTTPAWTRADSRYLESFWWFGLGDDQTRLRAYNYQRTPSCLRARGVIFNSENLDSV